MCLRQGVKSSFSGLIVIVYMELIIEIVVVENRKALAEYIRKELTSRNKDLNEVQNKKYQDEIQLRIWCP